MTGKKKYHTGKVTLFQEVDEHKWRNMPQVREGMLANGEWPLSFPLLQVCSGPCSGNLFLQTHFQIESLL
jgi:hypothetical protein